MMSPQLAIQKSHEENFMFRLRFSQSTLKRCQWTLYCRSWYNSKYSRSALFIWCLLSAHWFSSHVWFGHLCEPIPVQIPSNWWALRAFQQHLVDNVIVLRDVWSSWEDSVWPTWIGTATVEVGSEHSFCSQACVSLTLYRLALHSHRAWTHLIESSLNCRVSCIYGSHIVIKFFKGTPTEM